jgi:ribosomal protection tetracycline resistance protein
LNLGIVAHVDAGKTTLTERLLHAAGVIDRIGSVDHGDTQTDTLELERQRGITIKAAVVSFVIDDVTVNLIDTPGHPDFIAEVERVLDVLDGAVLVISAVEGVQAQTLVLMRALQRLRIPTLLFVNKIDRAGADAERVLRAVAERLTPAVIPVGCVHDLGTRAAGFTAWGGGDPAFRARLAELVAERDAGILEAYVDDEAGVELPRLRRALAAQTGRAQVHPVFFGSAITGAGVEPLMAGVAELLPAAAGDADGPGSGLVFKVERGPSGDRIAYARMFSGTVHTRERLRFGHDVEDKVTAISVFERGSAQRRASVSAGQIGKLWGLRQVQIGDRIGQAKAVPPRHRFAPPALETVVVARDPADKGRLRVALSQLAEQDPLINVRQDDARQEFSVSLYGEVQKQVVQATLADEFGVEVEFRETTPICIERPAGAGEAYEELGATSNPFMATVGLRVEPGPIGAGVGFRAEVGIRSVPMYVYKTFESFTQSMEQTVEHVLREGLYGWRVADCTVTMTECGYYAPGSTAADFRKLTPMVLMRAVERAGTMVCEPMAAVNLEIPAGAAGAVLPVLARLGAVVLGAAPKGEISAIEATVAAARVQELRRQLPGLTGGEGVLESGFGGYRPASGSPPVRRRTAPSPLNRERYLAHLAGRASQSAGSVRS